MKLKSSKNLKMKIKTDVRTQLEKLLEDDLREKVCKPLLNAFGAHAIEKYHGPRENGKDVYFAYKDLWGDYKHCCLFIKAGNIDKSGGKNDIKKIKTAIEEAIFSKFVSPLENDTEVYINEFYFICNGKLNIPAREYLIGLFQTRNFPNFKVIDLDKMCDLVKKIVDNYSEHIDDQYVFDVNTFPPFCTKIVSFREQFESKKSGKSIFAI